MYVPCMPRTARAVEAGTIYHVLNRGNGRMRLFYKAADYAAFHGDCAILVNLR